MKYRLKKAVVLGSGVMGSGIACHLANVGMEVLMLDILPNNKKQVKLSRNSVASNALQNALKSKPAPLYDKNFASRIKIGNFEDDFDKVADADWIIEAVVERIDIKHQLYAQIDKVRNSSSIVSSNTSTIPLSVLTSEMS